MLDSQLSGNEVYLLHYQYKIGYLTHLGTSLGGYTREQSIYSVKYVGMHLASYGNLQ